jgi:hypothetical protein
LSILEATGIYCWHWERGGLAAGGESVDEMRAIVCSTLMALIITAARAQAQGAREIMSRTGSCRNIGRSCWTAATSNCDVRRLER